MKKNTLKRITVVLLIIFVTAAFPVVINATGGGWTSDPAAYETADNRAQIAAFVTRLYELCLGRAPEEYGLNIWVQRLESGEYTGAEVAQGFMFSEEMSSKRLSNAAFVEILYNAMMGRTSDEFGKEAWLSRIASGYSWHMVFLGFVESVEFSDICANYGIKTGDVKNMTEMKMPDVPPFYKTQFEDITAAEWVAGIRAGINLANTFDAHAGDNVVGWPHLGNGTYAGTSVAEMESAWVYSGVTVTRELIDAMSEAGFNALRIPVTWFKVCDKDYNIRKDWMDRIEEVAGWAMANNMYVIINTHHDSGAYGEHEVMLFDFCNDNEMKTTTEAFVKIWQQIAERFRDYSEKLAFEGLNEPGYCNPEKYGYDWWGDGWTAGGTDNPAAREQARNIKKIQQIFVDTIRASGGNNAKRMLILTTPGATGAEYYQRDFEVPNDSAKSKIIVSLHMYAPGEFAHSPLHEEGSRSSWSRNLTRDTLPITRNLDLAHELFVSKGVPVIIGEMAAMNKNNTQSRADWAEFYYGYAKSKEIACFWWSDGLVSYPDQYNRSASMGLINRDTLVWEFPEIVAAIMRATR